MIHYVNPLDPDDIPLGSDSAPDVMDTSDWHMDTPDPVRPLGVPLDLELRLRDWETVRAVCDDYGFSAHGWKLFLDKLLHAVNVNAPPTGR